MQNAIQRRRRNRLTRYSSLALAGVVTAVVLGVEGFTDNATQPSEAAAPATAAPKPSAQPKSALERAGYPATTVGTLADDKDWLAGMIREVRANEVLMNTERIARDSDVRILAAGDLDDHARYAIVMYKGTKGGQADRWYRTTYLGKPGSAANKMLRVLGVDRHEWSASSARWSGCHRSAHDKAPRRGRRRSQYRCG